MGWRKITKISKFENHVLSYIKHSTQSSNENIGTIRALYGFYFYHKFSLIVLAGSNKETDIILYSIILLGDIPAIVYD